MANRFEKWSTVEIQLLCEEIKSKKIPTEEETYLLEEAIKELERRNKK